MSLGEAALAWENEQAIQPSCWGKHQQGQSVVEQGIGGALRAITEGPQRIGIGPADVDRSGLLPVAIRSPARRAKLGRGTKREGAGAFQHDAETNIRLLQIER